MFSSEKHGGIRAFIDGDVFAALSGDAGLAYVEKLLGDRYDWTRLRADPVHVSESVHSVHRDHQRPAEGVGGRRALHGGGHVGHGLEELQGGFHAGDDGHHRSGSEGTCFGTIVPGSNVIIPQYVDVEVLPRPGPRHQAHGQPELCGPSTPQEACAIPTTSPSISASVSPSAARGCPFAAGDGLQRRRMSIDAKVHNRHRLVLGPHLLKASFHLQSTVAWSISEARYCACAH